MTFNFQQMCAFSLILFCSGPAFSGVGASKITQTQAVSSFPPSLIEALQKQPFLELVYEKPKKNQLISFCYNDQKIFNTAIIDNIEGEDHTVRLLNHDGVFAVQTNVNCSVKGTQFPHGILAKAIGNFQTGVFVFADSERRFHYEGMICLVFSNETALVKWHNSDYGINSFSYETVPLTRLKLAKKKRATIENFFVQKTEEMPATAPSSESFAE